MEETTSPAAGGGGNRVARTVAYVLACLLAAIALAMLLWWLPARTASGYIIPDSRGVIAQTPSDLYVIWVRPWPWSTRPPIATVTLNLPGRGNVSYAAFASNPVSFFSGRAVPVDLTLTSNSTPFHKSGLISDIKIVWQGGSARRVLTDFWAVHAFLEAAPSGQIAGFTLLITSQSARPSLNVPIALLLTKVPQRIVAVSTPNPTFGPWQTPLCVSVPNAKAATSGSFQNISSTVRSLRTSACRHLTGPQAIVETGRNPTTPAAFYWQTILQEISRGQIVTVSGGAGESGFGVWPNAFNWWWFARGG